MPAHVRIVRLRLVLYVDDADVGVGVDESGRDDLAPRIDRPRSRRERERCADRENRPTREDDGGVIDRRAPSWQVHFRMRDDDRRRRLRPRASAPDGHRRS
jgi:hypothetical protein